MMIIRQEEVVTTAAAMWDEYGELLARAKELAKLRDEEVELLGPRGFRVGNLTVLCVSTIIVPFRHDMAYLAFER